MATNQANSGALGFEDKLWATADQLLRHGYPPDKQQSATATVVAQAELLSATCFGD